jgi:cation diffusion facilitator CzcD-associated flavoprotein CzcO
MTASDAEYSDVLIVGAGISGIGAAYRIHEKNPQLSYTVLERRQRIGGTWDLFRYPGIRSDSDIFTLSFPYEPWTRPENVADGADIRQYLTETARKYGIDEHIEFDTHVLSAHWDPSTDTWSVHTEQNGAPKTYRGRFLFFGTGYYNYDEPYTPEFPGIDSFAGEVVHPQHWPESLDYTGKKVVVIGSGATAVTVVPSMAGRAEHVTMLQRSPSYVLSLPAADPIANLLNRVLGADRAYPIIRRKNIRQQRAIYKFCQRFPKLARRLLMADVRRRLPEGYDVDTHFGPRYNPWDQRLCMVPNGDLFTAISSGGASVVTDRIDRFTPTGILLESGAELEADIVVTATGLNIMPLGGIGLSVDEAPVELSETVVFKSMLLSGVPNFAFAVGYTNSSWTLKVDLVCEHFCRLLEHMAATGQDTVVPVLDDADQARGPLLDLSSGYVQRRIAAFPKAGTRGPWTAEHAYEQDVERLRRGPVEDPALRFASRRPVAAVASQD